MIALVAGVWSFSVMTNASSNVDVVETKSSIENMDVIIENVTTEWIATHTSTVKKWEEHGEKHEFNVFKWIITSILMILVIVVIAMEKMHRTMVVFLFAVTLIFISHTVGYFYSDFNFITLEQAFKAIDGEVIALLTWMMIIIWVLSETWVFQWLAYKIFEVSKWNNMKLLVLFIVATAILSALLDNVTTMFLITPVAIAIARIVWVSPIAFLMPMILASNVWWAGTLIWDPPNIMIGSYSWLSFNDFLINMWIPVFFIIFVLVFQMKYMYRKEMKGNENIDFAKKVESLKEEYKILHPRLLKVALMILWFVILFFILHGIFHMPAAVPAITWAWILLLLRDVMIMRKRPYEKSPRESQIWILKAFEKDVEWPVLAFFIFLFMIVWALEHSGILTEVAILIQTSFWDNLLMSAIVILWVSAIASAFLDNIPFTAVMLPIVGILSAQFNDAWMNWTILWWALAFGACFGWNWTLIWASANIVTVWIMEKHWIKISFWEFFKVWFPSMLIQVALATVVIVMMVKMM